MLHTDMPQSSSSTQAVLLCFFSFLPPLYFLRPRFSALWDELEGKLRHSEVYTLPPLWPLQNCTKGLWASLLNEFTFPTKCLWGRVGSDLNDLGFCWFCCLVIFWELAASHFFFWNSQPLPPRNGGAISGNLTRNVLKKKTTNSGASGARLLWWIFLPTSPRPGVRGVQAKTSQHFNKTCDISLGGRGVSIID